jgi:hypothetical protein
MLARDPRDSYCKNVRQSNGIWESCSDTEHARMSQCLRRLVSPGFLAKSVTCSRQIQPISQPLPNSSRPARTVVPGQLACGAIRRAVEASKHNQRAMSKPTVTLTRNLSSPAAIGTVVAAIAADAPCARIGTGGANPESSVIHSTRPS